jgi:hypothetical protein
MITCYRTLLGTFVYTVIVVLAAPFPTATGLFLTFPALNGLAFFFSSQSDVESMARSMLWVPVINGALCAIYILAFLAFAQAPYITFNAWLLVIIIGLAWWRLASLEAIEEGIPADRQVRFGSVVTSTGCVAVVVATVAFGKFVPTQLPMWSVDFTNILELVLSVLWQSKLKIFLFAMCLAGFLIATARLPLTPSVRGILGGLPVVPFGSLASIAGDGTAGLAERVHTLERMVESVWLGPAVAVWFIYGYSRYLHRRRPWVTGDAAARFAVLAVGWLLCGAVIAGIAYAISTL